VPDLKVEVADAKVLRVDVEADGLVELGAVVVVENNGAVLGHRLLSRAQTDAVLRIASHDKSRAGVRIIQE
jgi:hypothetical protein